MATKADLRRMVLLELKVIAHVTQAPSQTQADTCDLWIDGVRSMLLEVGLCWWDEDSIPSGVMIPLSKLIASQSCGAFGKNGKDHEAKEWPARNQLAGLKSSAETETTRATYF